jgi:hypothetical protein
MRVEPLSLRQLLTETLCCSARAADGCSEAYTPTPSLIQIMREELRVRMPDLANAPLLEARACQYEDTPAKSLLIDRHPEAAFRVNHEKVRSTIHRFGKTLRNLWYVGSARLSQAPIHPALHTSLQTPRRRRPPLSRSSSGGAPTTLGQPKKSTRSYAVVVVCGCNVSRERKTQGVHQQVSLATLDILVGIVAV